MSASTASNWAGNLVYAASRVHRPATIEQLSRIVGESLVIRAVGRAHSFSPVADTTGDLVCLDGLPASVEIDAGAGEVVVSAGMSYRDVAVALHRAGYALANLASLLDISVAGACATGTHGSGSSVGCLAADVTGLQLMGPDGDLVELHRRRDGERLAGSVVALGALGIVTRVTLTVEPAYEVAQQVHEGVPLDELAGRFDEVFGSAYSVSAFTDWEGEARVWRKVRTDSAAAAEPGWAGGHSAQRPLHPVPGMAATGCTTQLGKPGPWYRRLPHFLPEMSAAGGGELQSELFLPRPAAPAAIEALRGLAAALHPVLQVAEVRTVRADDLWLSPCYGRDTATFHFTWVRDEAAVRPVLGQVEEQLAELGARPHWGKLTNLDAGAIVAAYPRAAAFSRLLGECDPLGTFGNAFVDRLFRR